MSDRLAAGPPSTVVIKTQETAVSLLDKLRLIPPQPPRQEGND